MNNKIQLSGIFSEGYGLVPKLLMKSKEISQSTKLILCYFLSYTGAGITCWPSLANISEDLGMSKSTIIRSLREAKTKGFIEITKNNLGKGKGTFNIYSLFFMKDFFAGSIKDNSKLVAVTPNDNSKKVAGVISDNSKSVAITQNDSMQVSPEYCNININNNINNNNNKKNISDIKSKKLYEEFVYLSDYEYKKLLLRYDKQIIKDYILELNNYIGSKELQKRYKSHYYTILNWLRRAKIKEKEPDKLCPDCGNVLGDDFFCMKCKTFVRREDVKYAK